MGLIKISKTWVGSLKIVLLNKLAIVAGVGDSWGIGIEYSHYDKALSLKILPLYIILEPNWDIDMSLLQKYNETVVLLTKNDAEQLANAIERQSNE